MNNHKISNIQLFTPNIPLFQYSNIAYDFFSRKPNK